MPKMTGRGGLCCDKKLRQLLRTELAMNGVACLKALTFASRQS